MGQDHPAGRRVGSDHLPLHSSTAIQIGVGRVEQLGRTLLLDAKRRRAPGKPRSTRVGDSAHQGFDVIQSHPGQDHRELVASGPVHGVGRPQPLTKSVDQRGEGSVAPRVPLRIVDPLQTVEVDRHHRQFGTGPSGDGHGPGEHQIEGPSVADPGERVDQRGLFQLGERCPSRRVANRPPGPVVRHPVGFWCGAQFGFHRGFEGAEPCAHERRRLMGPGPSATGLGQCARGRPASVGDRGSDRVEDQPGFFVRPRLFEERTRFRHERFGLDRRIGSFRLCVPARYQLVILLPGECVICRPAYCV
jgi:hypothetical protein